MRGNSLYGLIGTIVLLIVIVLVLRLLGVF